MAFRPRNRIADYRSFAADARLAEQLGFHSIWTSEHRIWYDGWCPAPLHALALAAGATVDLRLGTGVLLAPQHDPHQLARAAAVLGRISGGRLDLGLGLGHRDVEFDTFGLRRDQRGRRMDDALGVMPAVWRSERAKTSPPLQTQPRIWIGGMAEKALDRAGRGGHNVLLPQTLEPEQVRRCVAALAGHAGWNGIVGVMRDVWIEDRPQKAREMRARLDFGFREEAGWWVLKGRPAFEAPAELERQMARVTGSALIGSAEEVADGLRALLAAGAGFLCLRINLDIADHSDLREQMISVAAQLPPLLGDAVDAPAGPRL